MQIEFSRLPRGQAFIAAALIAIAVVFGGGGVGYGYFNLVVQLAALGILVWQREAVFAFLREAPRALVVIAVATMAVPLLQLVPLPPAVWSALPGRDLLVQSLALVGAEGEWRAFTVDANRTALGFIALLPAFAVMALCSRLDRSGAQLVLLTIAALGLLNVALGAVQLTTGNLAGNWYPGGTPDVVYGTFANRNSAGIFLVIAMIAVAALPRGRGRRGLSPVQIAVCALLGLTVVLTQSRSSMGLLVVAAGFMAMRFFESRTRDARTGRGSSLLVPIATVALAGAAVFVLVGNERVRQAVGRFEGLETARIEIWQDSLRVAGRYWPIGSGAGTFDEVYQVDESLEHVTYARPGRAHNDYLEVAIESGVAGLVLVALWSIWLVRSGLQARASPIRRGAAAVLLCIALQSLLDYPLRSEALLCTAAAMVALLSRGTRTAD